MLVYFYFSIGSLLVYFLNLHFTPKWDLLEEDGNPNDWFGGSDTLATNSNEDGSDERTFPKCYAFAILASERGLPALL